MPDDDVEHPERYIIERIQTPYIQGKVTTNAPRGYARLMLLAGDNCLSFFVSPFGLEITVSTEDLERLTKMLLRFDERIKEERTVEYLIRENEILKCEVRVLQSRLNTKGL